MLDAYVLRPLLTALLRLCFGIKVSGQEHYRALNGGAVIICNHQSFLDPLILAVFMPEKPAFAMNVFQAEKWYFRWLGKLVTIYTLDPSKPMSMKSLIRDVQGGKRVVIFPEGRITTSGAIMKIYEGTRLLIDKTGADVLPLHIEGAQYSKFSNLGGLVRRRWFPRISLTFFAPRKIDAEKTHALYDLMTENAFLVANSRQSLLSAILEAWGKEGSGKVIASDITRTNLTYRKLFTRAFVLSDKLTNTLSGQSHVAVLLPNSLGVMVTFVALHMLRKIPCMLNFSAGPGNIVHACRIAGVKTVLTSRVFIEKGKLEPIIEALQKDYSIFYLEDLKPQVSLGDKLAGLRKAFTPRKALSETLDASKPDDPAVILYTSGSEGVPKGVALSHANLLSNIHQTCARVDLNPADTIFNALPVFHSFGLTAGMVLPMVKSVKTFLYPSPVHYRVVPELVYDTDATVMLGTDTFYRGYARYAHMYDFWRIRLAVAGAEKLKETTRQLWSEKYRVNILEGYGVTETSPVLSVNTPMMHKEGSVGRPMPGIECKVAPVEGLEKGGRLEVKGANVMLGYLKPDAPGTVDMQYVWYDTGDIVDIDEEGYITILGRAKRFAKIAGEMVSLQVVEDLANAVDSEKAHAAVILQDDRKGEMIILCTENEALTREQLQEQVKQKALTELYLPRQVKYVEELPRLGNGKVDYPALTRLMTVKED